MHPGSSGGHWPRPTGGEAAPRCLGAQGVCFARGPLEPFRENVPQTVGMEVGTEVGTDVHGAQDPPARRAAGPGLGTLFPRGGRPAAHALGPGSPQHTGERDGGVAHPSLSLAACHLSSLRLGFLICHVDARIAPTNSGAVGSPWVRPQNTAVTCVCTPKICTKSRARPQVHPDMRSSGNTVSGTAGSVASAHGSPHERQGPRCHLHVTPVQAAGARASVGGAGRGAWRRERVGGFLCLISHLILLRCPLW